jgi:hypothetical protein
MLPLIFMAENSVGMPPAIVAKGGALWRGHCGIAPTAL